MSFQHIPSELVQLFFIVVIAILSIGVCLYAISKAIKGSEEQVEDEIEKK